VAVEGEPHRLSAHRLDEPNPHPPLVLDEKRGPELCKRISRGVVERPEDRLAIDHGEREHLRLLVVAVLELLGNVDEASLGSTRASSSTSASRIGMPARCIRSSIEHTFA
jgi:hypothetical protein